METFLWHMGFAVLSVLRVFLSSDTPGVKDIGRTNLLRQNQDGITPDFLDCGSKATVNSVKVIPCNNPDVCELQTGSNATILIDFTTKENANNVIAVVHGKLGAMFIPFPIPQSNVCQSPNINCPLVPGVQYQYSVQLPVLKTYPRIRVTVKWEIQDERKVDLVCIEFPTRLV